MARDSQNRMERRAELYNQMADERANRVASAWAEKPAEAIAPAPGDVHAMWHFSPSFQPEQDFWMTHDQTLQQALQQAGPDPKPEDVQAAYKQAELTALQKVYPYRLAVAPVTNLEPEQAVKTVDKVFGTVQRIAQGMAGGDAG